MSLFYSDIVAPHRRSKASSRGHQGITSHTRTWDYGISVSFHRCSFSDEILVEIHETKGSNRPDKTKSIFRKVIKDAKKQKRNEKINPKKTWGNNDKQ